MRSPYHYIIYSLKQKVMKSFYSRELQICIRQINKTKARRLFELGKDVFFQSSNLRFDSRLQSPMKANKNGYSFKDLSFDMILNNFEAFNCDYKRGLYTRFYINENDYVL